MVLVALAACTVQVGGGAKPSALRDHVGINGLLADPAAMRHRPSLEVTIDRVGAARLTGVAVQHVPSATLIDGLVAQLDGPARSDLELRWASYVGDTARVGKAIEALGRQCGEKGPDDCDASVHSVWSFLQVSGSPARSELARTFPDLRPPACPAKAATVGDQFLSLLCGRPVRDQEAFDAAVVRETNGDGRFADSRTLWAAAAVARAGNLKSDELRTAVERAVGQSHVEGVFFDETPAQGTLLTSWALLHLAGGDRGGVDLDALAAAIRREPTDGAADRVMLARAGLALLGSTPVPGRGGRLVLRDPDGPYNPFIALAARDAGDLRLVSVGFSATQSRTTPERLASWILTRRIIEGRPITITDSDASVLRGMADPKRTATAASNPVPALLRDAALAAAGRPSEPVTVSVGCGGADWLVTVGDECDIRSSLLLALRHDFTSHQGAA
ncbi:hypothetical protein [Humibacillus xanthopallidus]|uniref:hypothetical protein n=1 Tax=Humibacillus xanthopallidus TaxID=412689 RepID=UPI001639AC4F|nr:hypothetical protein [Humibacillus xanthopallidus]